MAVINFEITEEECSKLKMTTLDFENIPFNISDFKREETSLIFDLLKKCAKQEITLYPRDESSIKRKEVDIARKLLDKFGDYIDMGLMGLAIKKERLYPFS